MFWQNNLSVRDTQKWDQENVFFAVLHFIIEDRRLGKGAPVSSVSLAVFLSSMSLSTAEMSTIQEN